ncbi:3' terminal RNA ribose 2'-O-methyltransferase Hen1 [Streptomyces sp. TS71-3]|uniref:3' terminal RNA ribose 2'-O-methyltransferase Hen1 n=1 Tax=Streptomyces sp. TS71-3 TaxID=2733862 RepID=UPI001B027C86|nr:3' terminal RNA ribose 2'-O-methyltransferase Hen1 [Streptomyces sp. TS71-3]GHJ40744.1 3' terminal RNA ribose 2'-O-methyltransferase Hen1 [Streptomyces sp. TS71-3]
MFLTITTTGTPEWPATDLGFLLHKHPDHAQAFTTSYGTAHVVYPEASTRRCTAALLLEVDPVALGRRGKGRGRGGAPDAALTQYVNDRPYAASSLFAVALGNVFSSAMKGRSKARPELVAQPLPLRVEVPALPASGGPALVRRLFEPLGWRVTADPIPLDTAFPAWGDSRYVRLVLEGDQQLAHALCHLYVLLPVLDDAKHYWVTSDEVDKLLRAGEGWLPGHPERNLITSRYLARRWSLAREAQERLELARLAEADDTGVEEIDNAVPEEAGDPAAPAATPAGDDTVCDPAPASVPASAPAATGTAPVTGPPDDAAPTVPFAVQRRAAVVEALRAAGASRVLDLGCGQGQLVQELLRDGRFTEVVGVDVSMRALAVAARRLRIDLPQSSPGGMAGARQAGRVRLLQGSLVYTDGRLKGYDAAVLCEVVEHLDPPRLPALEHAVFAVARPATVLVTTPNAEYNVRWESLPAGRMRHADHRFEWDRAEFAAWARKAAGRHGYEVRTVPVGPDDPEVGPPTQMAVFSRSEPAGASRPTTASGTASGPTTGRAA